MPRILSIATLYPNAHTPRFGTFVARQMEALAARDGWDVTVINPIGVPPLAFGRYKALAAAAVSGTEGGVAVHRKRFPLIPAIGGPVNPAMIARAIRPLVRELHERAPFDIVDAQFFYPDGPAAARIAQDLRLPLSIKARGADIQYWGGKDYALRKMRAAAAQASGLLAVSEAMKQDMLALGLPGERITVHYTGLDRSLFRPLDRRESRARLAQLQGIQLTQGDHLLATVGALIPRKGQALVIEALARLPDAQLALVGTGPDRASSAALAGSLGVSDRVHFLGSMDHEQLPVVLSAADAVVMPSSSEGLANAWVEALACGTPLVISDAGGARELVSMPQAGRIVARNSDAIAVGVREILEAQYAPDNVARTAERFSWEANAEALAAFYKKLIG